MSKTFEWDKEKNSKLSKERDVSFEMVVALIEEKNILAIVPGLGKFSHQKQYILVLNNYVYFVPFIENEEHVFLKTIIPSRKLTKAYLLGEI